MLGNYLTTHPVFTLLEKERDFVARKYALANERQKKKKMTNLSKITRNRKINFELLETLKIKLN